MATLAAVEVQAAKQQLQREVAAYRELQGDVSKLVRNRQELTSRYTETESVLTELKLLDDEANVFKAVGPVLVKQDLMEAKSNVGNRLDYIKKDIDRIDGQIKGVESKMLEKEKEMMRIQKKLQGQQG